MRNEKIGMHIATNSCWLAQPELSREGSVGDFRPRLLLVVLLVSPLFAVIFGPSLVDQSSDLRNQVDNLINFYLLQ